MARKSTVNTGLTGFKDSDALFEAKVAYSGLFENPFFLTPDEPLPKFLLAINDFEAKAIIAHRTFGAPIAARNASRIVLNEIYSNEAHYVNRISNGNLEMLITSRFIITGTGKYPEIANFSVVNGAKPGDLDFSAHAIELASSYEIDVRIVSLTAPNDWTHCTTMGSHTETVSGFISGELYEFRMRPVYSKSKGPYFDSIQIRVL